MPYVKVETAVPRNRKFLKAGPAPSWLWLCGLCYCQDNLTDGFVPDEVLNILGVKNARQLVSHLEQAGLWIRTEHGWHINDYLEHNRSAAQVAEIRANGNRGGRPKKTKMVSENKTMTVSQSETVAVAVSVDASDVVSVRKGVQRETPPQFPMDEWWLQLLAGYPPHRANRSDRVNKLFIDALLGATDGPWAAWTRMMSNLARNVDSHEWRVKGMAPALGKYLEEGLWESVWPASAPVAEQVTAKTARTLAAAAAAMKEPA